MTKPSPAKSPRTKVAKPAVPKALKPVVKPSAKPKRATAKKKVKNKPFTYGWFILGALVLILFSPFYYGWVVRSFASAWHWVNDIGEDPNYRHYKSFNIHVSEKYAVHGIDVSYAQGKIDWPKVKAMDENGLHLSFAFIKATEGNRFVDSYFQRNWREAAKTGLVCGAYHFFRPGTDGKAQARLLLKTVKPEPGDMPLVVDAERLDGIPPAQMRNELQRMLTYLQAHTRIKPILYTGLNFYTDYLKGYFDQYPLWIAHYNQPEQRIDKASNWRFWQHSSQATVNGIKHEVDFDTYKGDSLSFHRMLIGETEPR